MSYLNDFSLRIVGGTETPGGYVEMQHARPYKIMLHNHRNVRCDVALEIDGKPVGTFRVPAGLAISVERPLNDEGCFTFYKVGSPEAAQAGLAQGDPNLGLVRAVFTPEKPVRVRPLRTTIWTGAIKSWPGNDQWFSTCEDSGDCVRGSLTYSAQNVSVAGAACSYTAGGTGVSGHSDQQFVSVAEMDLDYTQQTAICLRLVASDYSGPRPLTAFSTPVPPRVG